LLIAGNSRPAPDVTQQPLPQDVIQKFVQTKQSSVDIPYEMYNAVLAAYARLGQFPHIYQTLQEMKQTQHPPTLRDFKGILGVRVLCSVPHNIDVLAPHIIINEGVVQNVRWQLGMDDLFQVFAQVASEIGVRPTNELYQQLLNACSATCYGKPALTKRLFDKLEAILKHYPVTLKAESYVTLSTLALQAQLLEYVTFPQLLLHLSSCHGLNCCNNDVCDALIVRVGLQ
jgi:pentatricopeptide repeat protein